jgi:hypothetical protein
VRDVEQVNDYPRAGRIDPEILHSFYAAEHRRERRRRRIVNVWLWIFTIALFVAALLVAAGY